MNSRSLAAAISLGFVFALPMLGQAVPQTHSTIAWIDYNYHNQTLKICRMNPDGTGAKELAQFVSNDNKITQYTLCASKDGTKIVYDLPHNGPDGNHDYGFRVMSIDGAPISASPLSFSTVPQCSFAPDGNRLFCQALPNGWVGICDLAGRPLKQLGTTANWCSQSPRWSPDGSQILTISTGSYGPNMAYMSPPGGYVATLQAYGSSSQDGTVISKNPLDANCQGFDWVPNTSPQMVYFCRKGEVWQVQAGGSQAQMAQVSHFRELSLNASQISCSPDGASFVFCNSGHDGELYISDIRCTKPPVKITQRGNRSICPSWVNLR